MGTCFKKGKNTETTIRTIKRAPYIFSGVVQTSRPQIDFKKTIFTPTTHGGICALQPGYTLMLLAQQLQ